MAFLSRGFFSALILIGLSGTAHADLVDSNWLEPEDNRTFTDTRTGLVYLDITETQGQSIEDVQALLSTDFAGWRFPTAQEVDELFFSITGTYANGNKTTLRYLSGPLFSSHQAANSYDLYGLFSDGVTSKSYMMGGNSNYLDSMYNYYERSTSLSWSSPTHGVWLVATDELQSSLPDNNSNVDSGEGDETTDVSAPFASAAMLALFGLLGLRRRT